MFLKEAVYGYPAMGWSFLYHLNTKYINYVVMKNLCNNLRWYLTMTINSDVILGSLNMCDCTISLKSLIIKCEAKSRLQL